VSRDVGTNEITGLRKPLDLLRLKVKGVEVRLEVFFLLNPHCTPLTDGRFWRRLKGWNATLLA
jgi:hypothetical protein